MPESNALSGRQSLRRRLMWAFTLLCTLALLIQAVALFAASEEQEEDLIDEVVNTALDGITRSAPEHAAEALPRHLTLYHAPMGTIPAGLPTALQPFMPGNREWFDADTEYHVGVRDHAGERFWLLYNTTEHEERLAYLAWALACGVVVVSLLALWLGNRLAAILLRQLEALAQRLDKEDPQPLVEAGQDREVALLAAALDDYRQRNAALIAREREFTANVSHELRTPLTRIRTSAELLQESGGDRVRATRIVLAVDELEKRLQGLLFLARGTQATAVATVDLHALVESQLDHYRDDCKIRGIQLENRVASAVRLQTDGALLSLLVDNLLRNAVRYTQAGSIAVGFDAGWLSVRDTGIGIPADKLAHVFERHFRACDLPDGMGLGLAIVRAVAERCGWQYALHSEPGVGTEVRVCLQGAGVVAV